MSDVNDIDTTDVSSDAIDAIDTPVVAVADVDALPSHVRLRHVSDKTRALFAEAGKKFAASQAEAELVPVTNDAPAPAAEGAKSAAATAAASPTPTAPAAGAEATATAAIDQRSQAALELRERALGEREAEVEKRHQAVLARENGRERYAEHPGVTVRDFIKSWTGATTDEEVRDEVADLISDLSANVLGLPVPDIHKNRVESRKALRAVKAYKQQGEDAKAEATKAAETAQQAAREQKAVTTVDGLLREASTKFPHLMAEDNPAAIVWDVIKTKHSRDGAEPNWEEAAQLANEHFRKRNDVWFAKRRSLLVPASATAPAPVGSEHQGKSAQGPRSSTLTNRDAATPVPAPTPQPDEGGEGFDREAHRRRSLARLRATQKQPAT